MFDLNNFDKSLDTNPYINDLKIGLKVFVRDYRPYTLPNLLQFLLMTLLSLNALTGQLMGSCLGNTKNASVGSFCHSSDANQTPHVQVFCLLRKRFKRFN